MFFHIASQKMLPYRVAAEYQLFFCDDNQSKVSALLVNPRYSNIDNFKEIEKKLLTKKNIK